MLIKKLKNLQRANFKVVPVGSTSFAIVDPDDYDWACNYHWRLRHSGHCYYAARRVHQKGKTSEIKMHREIAKTLPGYECHHLNHNTLDNRRKNLQNLLPSEHVAEHAYKESAG